MEWKRSDDVSLNAIVNRECKYKLFSEHIILASLSRIPCSLRASKNFDFSPENGDAVTHTVAKRRENTREGEIFPANPLSSRSQAQRVAPETFEASVEIRLKRRIMDEECYRNVWPRSARREIAGVRSFGFPLYKPVSEYGLTSERAETFVSTRSNATLLPGTVTVLTVRTS